MFEEPLHLKVNVPKIDYESIEARQREFEKRRADWILKIQQQALETNRLKNYNGRHLKELKEINNKIDELMLQS